MSEVISVGKILRYCVVFSLFLIGMCVVARESIAEKPSQPWGPHYMCDLKNGVVKINWYTMYDARSYEFRLDARPRSWNENCTSPNKGDVCISTSKNAVVVPVTPLVEYNWWVHAVNQDGYSLAMDGPNFTCDIPRPGLFHYTCLNNNTVVELSWQSFGYVDRYEVRLDAEPNSWSGSCSSPNPGDQCGSTTTTRIRLPIEQGVAYRSWAHSVQNDVWTRAEEGPEIQCGYPPELTPTRIHAPIATQTLTPTSTPTPTPTPTDTPTPTPSKTPTPTRTPTPTYMPSPTRTPNNTPTATLTPIPTNIPTNIPTSTLSATSTPTSTPTETTTPRITITILPSNTLTPTGGEIYCPRHPEGDATCDDIIDVVDYACWKAEYVDGEMGAACVRTADFDSQEGVAILDFAIWQINFIKSN